MLLYSWGVVFCLLGASMCTRPACGAVGSSARHSHSPELRSCFHTVVRFGRTRFCVRPKRTTVANPLGNMVGQIFDSWCICCRSCLRPHVRWFWSGNASGTMGDSVASQNGYFAGFTYRTWMVVVINAFLGQVRMTCLRWPCLRSASSRCYSVSWGGWWSQVVSRVMKYADNITKVFASSSGVVITMVLSAYLFDFSMTLLFNLGTGTSLVARRLCMCARAGVRVSACVIARARACV